MSGGSWVAGSVRARLLARHCLGRDGAREIAATGSLESACARLAGSAYGRSPIDAGSAVVAQHAIWAAVVWDLRVLAGWLPGPGVAVVRTFVGFFEIDNIEAHLAFLADGVRLDVFELGGLGTVWTRARAATSVGELRAHLLASPWRDPGTEDRARILMSLRLEWARRLGAIDVAAAWGAGAAALVVARSLSEGAIAVDDLGHRAPTLGRRRARQRRHWGSSSPPCPIRRVGRSKGSTDPKICGAPKWLGGAASIATENDCSAAHNPGPPSSWAPPPGAWPTHGERVRLSMSRAAVRARRSWSMSSRRPLGHTQMQRLALVAPRDALRQVLVEVADSGTVDLDDVASPPGVSIGPAATHLQGQPGGASMSSPRLARGRPDLDELARRDELSLLAGEAELERRVDAALLHGRVAALLGWIPDEALPALRSRIEPLGGAAVVLPRPLGVDPPTLLAPRRRSAPFRVLVDTYGTVRYADMDPTPFAAIAFALMFGMMFGDAGRGLLLVGFALWAHSGKGLLGRFRAEWALILAAGLSATAFGIAFGEVFGPTHVVPAVWLVPLDDPTRLLVSGVILGAGLLGISQVIGTVNRWREGGARFALYSPSGGAGLFSFVGLGFCVAGVYEDARPVAIAGGVLILIGTVLVFSGGFAAAGGRGAGIAQATVESFEGLVRLGSNVVSFARLAAFGLTAAAIGSVVWDGTTALWKPNLAAVGAILLFVVGNVAAFALEALVVGVQALRLEYYELFSRMLGEEGRPFRPWHVAIDQPMELVESTR